jgi:hypothetical protein
MVMENFFYQGGSSLHLNDVSKAILLRQMVESVIMFFSIQLLVKREKVSVITLIDGNG